MSENVTDGEKTLLEAQDRIINPSNYYSDDEITRNEFESQLDIAMNGMKVIYEMMVNEPSGQYIRVCDAMQPHLLQLSRIECIFSNHGGNFSNENE